MGNPGGCSGNGFGGVSGAGNYSMQLEIRIALVAGMYIL
jgi:hypothetical protein